MVMVMVMVIVMVMVMVMVMVIVDLRRAKHCSSPLGVRGGSQYLRPKGVTLLLHCCYTVVILLLHCYSTVVTLLLHCCYAGVAL
jgi:hypothetical protein